MQTKAGSCPKLVSETLHSLQGHAGVWSQVKGCMCALGAGWEGVRSVNGGAKCMTYWTCYWCSVAGDDLCPIQVLPYLVIVAKLHKWCPQPENHHLSFSCSISDYFIRNQEAVLMITLNYWSQTFHSNLHKVVIRLSEVDNTWLLTKIRLFATVAVQLWIW